MSDRVFIDTNVLIYYVSDDIMKKRRLHDLFVKMPLIAISTQVINEFVSVSIRKKINSKDDTLRYATEFMEIFDVVSVEPETVRRSFEIFRNYNYSCWDSLIIAAALQAKAKILYSEDLQHNQKINGKLTIINPFA